MEIPEISNTQVKGTAVTGEIYEIFGMKLQVVEDSDNIDKDTTSPMSGTMYGCLACALIKLCGICQHDTKLKDSFMPCADSKNFNNRHFVKVEE